MSAGKSAPLFYYLKICPQGGFLMYGIIYAMKFIKIFLVTIGLILILFANLILVMGLGMGCGSDLLCSMVVFHLLVGNLYLNLMNSTTIRIKAVGFLDVLMVFNLCSIRPMKFSIRLDVLGIFRLESFVN